MGSVVGTPKIGLVPPEANATAPAKKEDKKDNKVSSRTKGTDGTNGTDAIQSQKKGASSLTADDKRKNNSLGAKSPRPSSGATPRGESKGLRESVTPDDDMYGDIPISVAPEKDHE